ncbi:MAG: GatB/YqeY domain-containing protein [Xanthomonadales bacterium]|nr:GatB/YqeY domain-containing protein [Xanthomonadales bacterium]
MGLKTQINEDMKAAMRAKETQRLSAIRLLLAAIKQREVDERTELDDQQIIGVIEKMIKQRRESVSQYEKASRTDLAEAEKFELEVLQAYMPQPLSQAEIDAAVTAAVEETGAQSVRDMGKVMAALKSQLAGRADMGAVSALVKGRLDS